jgi:hypothetical protein
MMLIALLALPSDDLLFVCSDRFRMTSVGGGRVSCLDDGYFISDGFALDVVDRCCGGVVLQM